MRTAVAEKGLNLVKYHFLVLLVLSHSRIGESSSSDHHIIGVQIRRKMTHKIVPSRENWIQQGRGSTATS